ncbi:MAG: sulfate transporter family protein [Parvibaculum sp.]|uniref:sulfate transporter family protein n=1 Tax=Parvibaculum sp. TaxID=2024848 RepID=UPI0025D0947C|nr:sulfate transporter family protein [Parvibaculum sp.]MCE9648104.1 sulfate transporter family protein [Parvibaculum sp.]
MFSDALRALAQTFSQPFRRVFWLSLLSTIVVLALFGAGAQWALDALPQFGTAWLDTTLEWVARFFAVIVLIPLVHPVVSLVASFFLERIAAKVEARDYPLDPPGRDQALLQSLLVAIRFTAVLILVNIVALPFYLVPGLNLALFWIVNGYLLGREYFELVALRHMEIADARALRRRHGLRIFIAGVVIAAFATVPFLNLLSPLFATAFMVHTAKRIGLT